MLFSFPLTNFTVQFGGYISAEDSFFRLYGSVGMFLRVIWDFNNAETPILLDPLSPVGFLASFGAELPIAGDFRFFFELTPTLFMSMYPELMHSSVSDVPVLYFFLPWGTLSLANIRFGVRWLL
jgi:hypothetical protein